MPAAAFFRASTTRRTITVQRSAMGTCVLSADNIRAKVSSIFTISLALVSMNPKLCCLLHSSPSLAAICLLPCKSHLLPATMHTGKIWFCSILSSLSMSIICVKYSSASRELDWVMSYTRRKASHFRFACDQRPRYSSWPAVSVRRSEYVVPSIVRVTE
jgi:hypothetical protein